MPREPFLKKGRNERHQFEIYPKLGHIHFVDEKNKDTGVKTWKPVSFADDKTRERLRLQDVSISKADAWFKKKFGKSSILDSGGAGGSLY